MYYNNGLHNLPTTKRISYFLLPVQVQMNEIFFEENKDIQCILRCLQTILNELRSLGRTYDNYDHIDKILRSISRNWRPQVIVLRDLKNLDSMSLWKLVATLKVHEQVL